MTNPVEVRTCDNGTHQTVIHRTEGLGTVGIICAAISFCCLLGIGGVAWMVGIELNKQTAELHDLRAWRDVHNNDIGALKAKLAALEKPH